MYGHFYGLLLLMIITILINQSLQKNEDNIVYPIYSSSMVTINDTNIETNNETVSKINYHIPSINRQLNSETNSNVMNVIKNFDIIKQNNPKLLQKYLSKKEDHIFNDIWRRFSNVTNNNDDNGNETTTATSNNNVYEIEWQPTMIKNDDESEISELDLSSLSSENPIQFEQDLMSAHETQTQNHKDHLTKLISTSNSNDAKNNDKQLSHRRGQSHISSSPDANNFQEYLSCCDQLFNKYGNRNYIQEDIFMIPESEPYIPVNLDGPGPPPVLITEYPNNNRALYSHGLRLPAGFVNNDIKIDSSFVPSNLKDYYSKIHRHHPIECLNDIHHHHHHGNNHHYGGHFLSSPTITANGQLISTQRYDSNSQILNNKINWKPIEQPIPINVHRISSTSIPAAPIITSHTGMIQPFPTNPTISFNEIVNNPSPTPSSTGPLSTKTMIPYKHSIPISPSSSSFVSHQPEIMSMNPELSSNNYHPYHRLNQWPTRSMMGISPPPHPHSTPGFLSKKLSLLSKKYLG